MSVATGIDFDTFQALAGVPFAEAAALDEQRWDDYLALYTDDCVYWVPAWDGEHTLTADPTSEVSLIYIEGRDTLADRVWRFTSGQSPASLPLPRTSHLLGNVEVTGAAADEATLRCTWHTVVHRRHETEVLAGRSRYHLRRVGEDWRIARRESVLITDYATTALDLYHL